MSKPKVNKCRCLRGLAEAANESEHHSLFAEIMTKGYDDDFEPAFCPEPTEHAPGSTEKIELMRLRLKRGEALHNDADNKTAATIEAQEKAKELVVAIYKNRKRMW